MNQGRCELQRKTMILTIDILKGCFGNIGNHFWQKSLVVVVSLTAAVTLLPLNEAVARGVSVYTLAKVKLDVTADNAVDAKNQALKEGPLQALRMIFKRFAPFRAYDRLETLTAVEADNVIEGFAVRNERNSSTRYLALLDYNFSRKRLQALLVKKGVPFFDRRSGKQVLMPVFSGYQDENNSSENEKSWWQAWRAIDLKHALTDTKLYKAKSSDHQKWQQIIDGNYDHYRELRQRYAVKELILVDVRLNEQKDKLTLRIFGEDHQGFIDYSQEMPVEHGLKKTYEMAAIIAFGIVEGRWREPQIAGDVVAVSTGSGDAADSEASGRRLVDETIFMRVTFRGLRDWQQIRKRLQRIPGVQKMQVNSLSPRGADLRMNYPGGATHLQKQLASYGFAIDQNGNELTLRSIQR